MCGYRFVIYTHNLTNLLQGEHGEPPIPWYRSVKVYRKQGARFIGYMPTCEADMRQIVYVILRLCFGLYFSVPTFRTPRQCVFNNAMIKAVRLRHYIVGSLSEGKHDFASQSDNHLRYCVSLDLRLLRQARMSSQLGVLSARSLKELQNS
jgi:hypothetical protein